MTLRRDAPTLNERMKVDAVTTWNDPDELGERIVRYDDVRCPECGRMFWCLYWEKNGYPEVHCDVCGIRESWPFNEMKLKERYEHGTRPADAVDA